MAGPNICKTNYMLTGDSSQYNEVKSLIKKKKKFYLIDKFKQDLIPKIFKFFPASAGYRQFVHYGQIIEANGKYIGH